jgi:alkylation response protein AidB-like acyl-CoA dehydrogenase
VANFYSDNDDLRFYTERYLNWQRLAELTEMEWRAEDSHANVAEAKEFYQQVMEMVGQVTAEAIAPRAHELDTQMQKVVDKVVVTPPAFNEVCETINELGLHGLCLPRELGGLNVPLVVYMANAELFARADAGIMTHVGFHGGIAMALFVYSIFEGTTEMNAEGTRVLSTRFGDAIAEIAAGEAWGAMDITEPNAGSDMARLSTKAVLGDDGVWRLTGQKIFITSGHGKYHVVIARTQKEGGLDALSLFMVPLYEDTPDGRLWHGHVSRVEEKLGHKSSPTCSVEFEETPGELIGKTGDGFRLMLLLMNNARVGVAFEAIGVMENALRQAQEYAAQRPSMGKMIDQHEMIADLLDEMDIDIRACRALAMHGAYHEEMSQKLRIKRQYRCAGDDAAARAIETEEKTHAWEARRVTPMAKYFGSEKAVEIAQRAIQIHGGVGYTKEYGVEKLLRDAMVLPIYEGTSQIQSLMVMKDALMQAMKSPQAFARSAAHTQWRSLSAKDQLERRVCKLRVLADRAQTTMIAKTAGAKFKQVRREPLAEWLEKLSKDWDPKRDFAFAMLHAERFMRLLVDATVAEIFWEQCEQYPERREILERWLERAEPRSRFLYDEITTRGARLLRGLAAAEAARAEAAE